MEGICRMFSNGHAAEVSVTNREVGENMPTEGVIDPQETEHTASPFNP